MKSALLWSAILVVTAFVTVSAQEHTAALTAVVTRAVDAQSTYKPEVLDEIYASDYVEISPVGEVDSREKAIGFYDLPAEKQTSGSVSLSEVIVREYGSTAVVIAKASFVFSMAGSAESQTVDFRSTYVLRKEGADWKISSVQFTGIRPPRAKQ